MPGRVGRVRCQLTAVVDAVDDPPGRDRRRSTTSDASSTSPRRSARRSPRSSPASGAFRCGVVVETEAELGVDYPGTAAPPSDGRAPLRTRTETTRIVSELVSRPATEKDAAAFALSEETRVVGIERLVEPRESLR